MPLELTDDAPCRRSAWRDPMAWVTVLVVLLALALLVLAAWLFSPGMSVGEYQSQCVSSGGHIADGGCTYS